MRLLKADEIEVKIKKVTKNGAVALLYKTARVDMAILDETFGADNWTDDYKEIKGNLYCGIGVRMDKTSDFVWKWDCGIESREDGEGNQKKGEASDAFKRAGFKWGIGRELYTAPFIFLPIETVQENGKWVLKDLFARFYVDTITYAHASRDIESIIIIDNEKQVVYPSKKKATKTALAPEEIPTAETLAEVQAVGTTLQKIADYYKCAVDELTEQSLKAAIKMRKELLDKKKLDKKKRE